MAKFLAATPGPIRTRLQEFSDQIGVWVADFGAVGNGVTDDTAAFQAAIAAANGKVPVLVPAATYMVNAATSILFNVAGTRMVMAPGAVLKVITNALGSYVCVLVSTADCSIEGGTIMGDVTTHTGGTGEWGHGLSITTGGDRFRAVRVTVKNCWGDGFYIALGPTDVSLLDCIADANRRQGLSVVGGTRCRVIGGSYINTGTIAATAPSAGIDVEPNPSSGVDATDCIIDGVVCSGNVGPGIQLVRATAQTTSVTVSNSICRSNVSHGISAAGSAGTLVAELNNNTCQGNTGWGVNVAVPGVTVNGGHYYGNVSQGIVATAKVVINGGNYETNGKTGILLSTGSDGSIVTGSKVGGNGTGAATTYYEVDIYGVGITMTGVVAIPATSGNRAVHAWNVRAAATGLKLKACDGTTGTTGIITLGTTDTIQLPNVGAAVTTVNAACTDLATAVALLNQIRTLLINNAGLAK